MLFFFPVPEPNVDFISNASNPALSGSSLTLICIVEFHPAVDLPMEVDIKITSPDGSVIVDGSHNPTRTLYTSKAVLGDITHEDEGIYTCSVNTGRNINISKQKNIQIG